MSKINLKRKLLGIICICLAGTLMFTGCNKDKDKNDEFSSNENSAVNSVSDDSKTALSTTIEKDYIYHESQSIEVPENYEMSGNLNIAGEKIYMQGTKYSENYEQILENNIFEFDISGNILNTIPVELADYSNISTNIAVDSNGNMCYIVYQYHPNNEDIVENDTDFFDDGSESEKYILVMIDKDGKKIFEKDLNEYYEEQDYFYISNVYFGDDGNIYMQNDNLIIVLDNTGNELFTLKNENDIAYINTIVNTNENKITVIYYDMENKVCAGEIDTENKKLGEKKNIDIPNNVNGFLNGSGEYSFYVFDSNNMYGVNIETGESTKLINWIDSDISASRIMSMSVLSDGKFIMSYYDGTDWTMHISVIEKTDADSVKNQQIITLAGNYIDDTIYSAAIKFNKENENYRIKITDYSEYSTDDDWNAGETKFNADMATGNIADIIIIDNNMPVESLASKGILADINEFFDKDSEIKREDYFENILKAFETKDGKLYSIVPSFHIETLIGKTSNLEGMESWNLSEFIDYAEGLDEGTEIFASDNMTSNSIFYALCYNSMNNFVNLENKTCDFNSESFIKLLEFAGKYPSSEEYYSNFDEDMDYEAYFQDMYAGYRDNKIILEQGYFSDLNSIYQVEKADFGEDVSFIGYPSSEGNGSCIGADLKLGISAKSDNQDAAWQFIKYFLSDEYQESSWSFPLKKSVFEKKAEDAMTPYTYTDENGETVVDENVYNINGVEFKIGYMDEEHKNKYMDFISSVDKEVSYNSEIVEIIDEEVQAYFSGQKSAQETADIIQNRVKIYINETF